MAGPGQHTGRPLLGVGDQIVGQGQAQTAIEHHPQGRSGLEPGQAHVEPRIVLDGGSAADQDGVVRGAQEMAAGPGDRSGDPATLATAGGDTAVQSRRQLQGDEWLALLDALEITGEMFGGGLGAQAAGSTVIEKNLDRITIVVALIFTFVTLGLALMMDE